MSYRANENLKHQGKAALAASTVDAEFTLEELASQFIDEHRRWENPSIEGYAASYPEYATEILESFPVLVAMEQWKGNQEFSRLRSQAQDPSRIKNLGDCRIVRELSRNRTAVTYEAIQGKWNRRVLLKLLPWKSEMTPRWRERFDREARLVSRLRHPHIVSFYKSGEDSGYCYALMQLVDGVSLDRIITVLSGEGRTGSSKKLTQGDQEEIHIKAIVSHLQQDRWRTLSAVALQMTQALSYAHSRNTLHHDLKPENILLDSQGHAWLTNFSLAQFAEGGLELQPLNTLCYQAPERFRGESHQQSDVYSLGMVLYELATLTPAFGAESRSELVDQILHQDPQRPRERNALIPVDLETIILNCLAKQSRDRYPSAEALRVDLLRFSNGTSVKRLKKACGWLQRIGLPGWVRRKTQARDS